MPIFPCGETTQLAILAAYPRPFTRSRIKTCWYTLAMRDVMLVAVSPPPPPRQHTKQLIYLAYFLVTQKNSSSNPVNPKIYHRLVKNSKIRYNDPSPLQTKQSKPSPAAKPRQRNSSP